MMQPFERSTIAAAAPAPPPAPRHPAPLRCAALLLETTPRIMAAVRGFMAKSTDRCTVPQFRTLWFVNRHSGASLSDLAGFLGLALPSASRQVDHLVTRGWLVRELDAGDRRRMRLRITPLGDALLESAQAEVRLRLSGMLNRFNPQEMEVLERALSLLQDSFPPLAAPPPTRA